MTDHSTVPRFIAWGELLWDLFPDGPRLGGAAANAAYHAACWGADARLVSRVGRDELGRSAKRELAARGVEVGAVQEDEDAPTGTVHVDLDQGEPRYRIAEGVAWDRIAWHDGLREVFAGASVVLFGTLAQRSALGFDAIEQALGHTPAGAVRLCDLNVREPYATRAVVDRALSLANVVKLNEAEVLVLGRLFAQPDVISWLLHERAVGLVALTRGSRGALLATAQQRIEHPGFPLSASDGDAVGAGDAFSATLGLARHEGRTLAECLERANRYAAHVASRRGGMPPPPAAPSARRVL